MKFEKGNTKGKGRGKGTPNKLTSSFKQLVTDTFRSLEKTPKKGMASWAKENQTDFYKIASKLIPTELAGTIKHDIIVDIPDDED